MEGEDEVERECIDVAGDAVAFDCKLDEPAILIEWSSSAVSEDIFDVIEGKGEADTEADTDVDVEPDTEAGIHIDSPDIVECTGLRTDDLMAVLACPYRLYFRSKLSAFALLEVELDWITSFTFGRFERPTGAVLFAGIVNDEETSIRMSIK